MFCKNCGALLDDDARFCNSCGTAVEGIEVQPTGAVANVAADRNKVLSDIDTAYQYAEQAEVQIRKLYDLQDKRDTITDLKQAGNISLFTLSLRKSKIRSKNKKELMRTLKDYGYEKAKTLRVIKYISFYAFLLTLILTLFAATAEKTALIVLSDIIGTSAFIITIVTHILGKKEINNAIKDIETKIATDGQNYYDEGCRILSEYATSYGVISSNYMNTRALDYMRQTIVDGRADTLKEALNLFVGYENQLRLERAQDEHYQELLRQQDEMRRDMNKGQASSDLGDALILFGLLFS